MHEALNSAWWLPMLGATWQELIVPGIIVTIMFMSWLANMLKGQKTGPKGGSQQQSRRQEARDLAAQRREQLRLEQASQRQTPPTRVSTTASTNAPEPGNLSMAERIARARAKAQYDQRAATMRQGQAPARPGAAPPTEPRQRPSADASVDERRRVAQRQAEQRAARQHQEAERARRIEELRRQQEQAAQRARQQQRRQQQTQPQRQQPTPTRGIITVDQVLPERHEEQDETVHRHVADVAPSAPAHLRAGLATVPGIGTLTRGAMRNAIILKELLDRPVAMRDPQEHPINY